MATCAIVGASPEFNAEDFKARYEAGMFEFVIAVDAGFAYLEELGVKPDMAVGDFDSLGYLPKCRRVSRFPVKKDKSDMELALEKAVAWDYDDLVVYAALGGRLDHTIANLQLVAKFSEREFYVTAVGEGSRNAGIEPSVASHHKPIKPANSVTPRQKRDKKITVPPE